MMSMRRTLKNQTPCMKDGGDLRTGQGGHVPGSGHGDKIDAKYEPGEFVASNDMLDAAPGLREQLHTLRSNVLAAKGMTPEQANAKALSYDGSTTRSSDERQNQFVEGRLAGRSPGAAALGDVDDQGRGSPRIADHPDQKVSSRTTLRAADGFEVSSRPWNGSQDSRLFAQQPGPGNPNVSAERLESLRNPAPPAAPSALEPPAAQPAAQPAARPTMRAGIGAQAGVANKVGYAGARMLGGATSLLQGVAPAAIGGAVVSDFNNYKINDPDVDSSATGTFGALRRGDFAGAGRSASKGALETGMDLGSTVAGALDYVIPGKAPVSKAYNSMLRNQFGDQLVSNNSAAEPAAAAPVAQASQAVQPATADSAPMPGQDPSRVTLRGQGGTNVPGATNISKFTQGGKTLYTNVTGDDNDTLMSNRPGVSSVPGMSQGDIDRTLTNSNGSRWSASDNAIMSANLRDGVDPYRGTSASRSDPATAAMDQMRSLAMSEPGTAGRRGAITAMLAMEQNLAVKRGQDVTERDNIRTNETSLRNSAATNKLGVFNALLTQRNADRTHETGREDANFTQGQAAQKAVTEEIASMLPPGRDGKPDLAGAAQHMGSLNAMVSSRMQQLEQHIKLNPGDKGAAGELEGLRRRGVAQLDPESKRKFVTGVAARDAINDAGTGFLNPVGATPTNTSMPVTSLRKQAGAFGHDYVDQTGAVVPGRFIDRTGSFMGLGGKKNHEFDDLIKQGERETDQLRK